MASKSIFRVEVEALDAQQGYLVRGVMTVVGIRTEVNEHYDTEAKVRQRLATAFDAWTDQVDAE